MKNWKHASFSTLILIASFLAIYRMTHVTDNEISWDVLGYYLYLPATFVHHDPLLTDISWLQQLNEERHLTGTLYMVSSNDSGDPIYFFLMGMALFYLPFFLLASAFCALFGFPIDGFSPPYIWFLTMGGVCYTIIGLIFLRKILKRYFSEPLTSLLLFLLVAGTNYIHHLTLDNLATVNVLFMLTTIIIWNTIKWHENFKGKYVVIIGVCFTLMALVKPSEIFVLLIPLLWNVASWSQFRQKMLRLFSKPTPLLIMAGICMLIALPQILYWYTTTGHFIYDSYKNPGVGLDFLSPHMADVLFSYRKGWLIYTPLMFFALLGFISLYRRNKSIFWACMIYFAVSFYIMSSWTEWWYGAAFSCRPLIVTYPVLLICLGNLILDIKEKRRLWQWLFGILVLFCLFMNQFYWWQYRHYILDPYRTTKNYFWATFLKTNVPTKTREQLLVERDFTGKMHFDKPEEYQSRSILTNDYEKDTNRHIKSEEGNRYYQINESEEFCSFLFDNYKKITQKDHIWLKINLDIRFPICFTGEKPCLVFTMDRSNKGYGYYAPTIEPAIKDSITDTISSCMWQHVEFYYLTPEIRNKKDILKCYIWKRSATPIDVDNVCIEVFEKP